MMKEDFAILSAMTALGGAGIYFSEILLQRDLSIYWELTKLVGTGLSDFALGQLGDLSAPIAAGGIIGLASAFLGNVKTKEQAINKDLILAVTIGGGIAIGLLYTGIEFITMFYHEGRCGNPGDFCKGDFQDILAFSVPLISSLLFLYTKNHQYKDNLD